MDSILVVDVESTCWRGPPPPGQISEIIEVGVCELDLDSLIPRAPTSILVRPQSSEISGFCTELTSLRPADVSDADDLTEACRRLQREFRSRDRVWASYGDYDRQQFEHNCGHYGIGYPFGPSHINVKMLFALMGGLPSPIGMVAALERLGLEALGTHHRGLDDAHNVARILARLLARGREV
jgi:inhibitor of KinA sporulation pathway (predicted exonuclease)